VTLEGERRTQCVVPERHSGRNGKLPVAPRRGETSSAEKNGFLQGLQQAGQVSVPEVCEPERQAPAEFPFNPNGSQADIAGNLRRADGAGCSV